MGSFIDHPGGRSEAGDFDLSGDSTDLDLLGSLNWNFTSCLIFRNNIEQLLSGLHHVVEEVSMLSEINIKYLVPSLCLPYFRNDVELILLMR